MDSHLLTDDAEDVGNILHEVELYNGGPETSGSTGSVCELNL